jgi:16S rRNA C1402 N4-methylase RsmH
MAAAALFLLGRRGGGRGHLPPVVNGLLCRRLGHGGATAAHGCNNYVMPTPVFSREVLAHLRPHPRHTYLDMTFGVGGHTSLLLDTCPEAVVIASDCDPAAYQAAMGLSKKYPRGSLRPLRSRFSQLPARLKELGVARGCLDGAIVDTGCSAFQWTDQYVLLTN